MKKRFRLALRTCVLLQVLLLSSCGTQNPPSNDSESGPGISTQGNQEPRKNFLKSGIEMYSQGKEEVIIRDFFQDRRGGFFLDVGCAWPMRNSTTCFLELHLGWSGIGIDALAQYGDQWAKKRPNTKFVSYAVSDRSGDTVTFYQAKWPGNSSLIKDQAAKDGREEDVTPIQVETITLTDLLDANGVEKIDHLTIDIEGAEPAALAGFDIERFRPELVCIEAHVGETRGANEAGFLKYFGDHGYELIEEYLPYDAVNWYFRRIR